MYAEVGHAAAEHVDGPATGQLVGDPLGQPLLRLVGAAVQPDELVPALRLGAPQEGQQLGGVEAEVAPVRRPVALVPAVLHEVGDAISDSNADSRCAVFTRP